VSGSNVIDIQNLLQHPTRDTVEDDGDIRLLLQVEDCGDGRAYLIVGRRLPWPEAIAILDRHYRTARDRNSGLIVRIADERGSGNHETAGDLDREPTAEPETTFSQQIREAVADAVREAPEKPRRRERHVLKKQSKRLDRNTFPRERG
jgi:hypothetical protein